MGIPAPVLLESPAHVERTAPTHLPLLGHPLHRKQDLPGCFSHPRYVSLSKIQIVCVMLGWPHLLLSRSQPLKPTFLKPFSPEHCICPCYTELGKSQTLVSDPKFAKLLCLMVSRDLLAWPVSSSLCSALLPLLGIRQRHCAHQPPAGSSCTLVPVSHSLHPSHHPLSYWPPALQTPAGLDSVQLQTLSCRLHGVTPNLPFCSLGLPGIRGRWAWPTYLEQKTSKLLRGISWENFQDAVGFHSFSADILITQIILGIHFKFFLDDNLL